MASKRQTHSSEKGSAKQNSPKPATQKLRPISRQQIQPAALFRRVTLDPRSLTRADVLQLHRTIGNRAVAKLLRGTEQSAVQRQAEEEEEIQMKPDSRPVGPEGGKVPPQVESAINRARGGGQPLESTVQEHMSETLGHDFSGVRVHTGSEANTLNRQLSAKAFTTGGDIFFRRGEYNPGSSSGRELIAHELSHVVQQNTGRVRGGGSGMTVRPADDAFEQEADTLSKTAAPVQLQEEELQLPVVAGPNRAAGGGIGRAAALGGRSIITRLATAGTGRYQLQRAVLSVMHADEWVAEVNKPLVTNIAKGPVYDWGKPRDLTDEKVVVMGHGVKGKLLDTRKYFGLGSSPTLGMFSGNDIGEEIGRAWSDLVKLKNVILWSCYAGKRADGGKGSLVDDTKAKLKSKGASHVAVTGAVGAHIPDVITEIRYSAPAEGSKEKELFDKLEAHHRFNNYLAKSPSTPVMIKKSDYSTLTKDRIIQSPKESLHTWDEIIAEKTKRTGNPGVTKKDAKDLIVNFYHDLFSDSDVTKLLKKEGYPSPMWFEQK